MPIKTPMQLNLTTIDSKSQKTTKASKNLSQPSLKPTLKQSQNISVEQTRNVLNALSKETASFNPFKQSTQNSKFQKFQKSQNSAEIAPIDISMLSNTTMNTSLLDTKKLLK
jgi:hypothetical protein